MSFKTHLLIVSLIIISVMIFWSLLPKIDHIDRPENSAPIARRIIISHASWGMNCNPYLLENTINTNNMRKKNLKTAYTKDNIFKEISLQCNGKLTCDINAANPWLKHDPQPECTPKSLEIEYRCFSFDRPWRTSTTGGSITLDCTDTSQENP